MNNLSIVVLAAGLGTRMKSKNIKVLHRISGITILEHIYRTLLTLNPEKIIFVVGYQEDEIKKIFIDKRVEFVNQSQQLGTADAVKQTGSLLSNYSGKILIIPGDCPLITGETLKKFIEFHSRLSFLISLITTILPDPRDYGRVVREADNMIIKIVEKNDAKPAELAIKEVNSGIYLTNASYLYSELNNIRSENKKGEFYLTDVINTAAKEKRCGAYLIENHDEITGINSRIDLARASAIIRRRVNNEHMLNGVTLIDPNTTYIDMDVKIGKDTTIYPGVVILGKSIIGENCTIMPHVTLKNSTIPENSTIE